MATGQEDLLTFKRFSHETPETELLYKAALEKLQTLYPHKRIITADGLSIEIESDSLYSENGHDIYELGLISNELPALQNTTSGEVMTFRL